MLRYAITDGSALLDPAGWVERTRRWLQEGLEFIQIRERFLSARELARLTSLTAALPNPYGSKILINDRLDVALACGAHGVHLRDHSVSCSELRKILPPGFLIAVSCHDLAGVSAANGADLLVVAPIFQPISKEDIRVPLGLSGLAHLSMAANAPVVALGGITKGNAAGCIAAGAAGVAGITLFHSELSAPA